MCCVNRCSSSLQLALGQLGRNPLPQNSHAPNWGDSGIQSFIQYFFGIFDAMCSPLAAPGIQVHHFSGIYWIDSLEVRWKLVPKTGASHVWQLMEPASIQSTLGLWVEEGGLALPRPLCLYCLPLLHSRVHTPVQLPPPPAPNPPHPGQVAPNKTKFAKPPEAGSNTCLIDGREACARPAQNRSGNTADSWRGGRERCKCDASMVSSILHGHVNRLHRLTPQKEIRSSNMPCYWLHHNKGQVDFRVSGLEELRDTRGQRRFDGYRIIMFTEGHKRDVATI